MGKLFGTIITSVILLTITACSPSAASGNSKTRNNSESKTYTLSGKLNISVNALPNEFVIQKSTNGRSAAPTLNLSNKDFQYSVNAVQGSTTIEGSINTKANSITYTIPLSAGEWSITAALLLNNQIVLTGETSITISETENEIPPAKDINLFPLIDKTTKGSIKLSINNTNEKLPDILCKWHWSDSNPPANDISKHITSTNPGVFEFSSINSGSYDVQLSFYWENTLLYQCHETITVFGNLTTDSWYGNSPYINDKKEFEISKALCDSFQSNNIFTISDGTTLYYLWSNSPYEENTIKGSVPSIENELGGQVFTSISEGLIITDSLQTGSTFCFDGTTLYAPPYRYKNTYVSYKIDESFNLRTIIEETNIWDSGYYLFPANTSCVFLDGYLYFIFQNYYENGSYYIGRYNTETKNFAYTSTPICTEADGMECPAFTVTHKKAPNTQEITEGVIYYTLKYSQAINLTNPSVLYRRPFYIEPKTITSQDPETPSITFNSIEFSTDQTVSDGQMYPADFNLHDFATNLGILTVDYRYDLCISDMTIIDNILYVLVYYSLCPDEGSPEYYIKDGDNYVKFCDSFISNGGIMKFDTSSNANAASSFVPQVWQNYNGSAATDNKLLGFYTLPTNVAYYKNSSGVPLSDQVFPVQPPEDSENNYFFGPRKIIAIKPDEIIIADDGGYIEADDNLRASDTSKPKNRVVTVNLATESITNSVEVGATFSASYTPGTGFFCFSEQDSY